MKTKLLCIAIAFVFTTILTGCDTGVSPSEGNSGGGDMRITDYPRPSVQDVFLGVCRLNAPTGFKNVTSRAKRQLGPVTHVKYGMKLFVTFADGYMYAATNYVSPGERIPAKITTNENLCLEAIIHHMVCTEPNCVSSDEIKILLQTMDISVDASCDTQSREFECVADDLRSRNLI